MKNNSVKSLLLVLLLAMLSVCGLRAQEAWGDPSVTGQNKQLPRTQLINYPSAELALARGAGNNDYRQVLDEWKTASTPEGKTFTAQYKMPFSWVEREVFVRIAAAPGSLRVKVNGREVGYSQASKGGIEFNITKFSKEGSNDLEITVFSPYAASVLENFDSGSAIQRPAGVCVFSQPRIRVRDVVVGSTYDNQCGQLSLGAIIQSHLLNEKSVRIHYELYSPDNKKISEAYREERFSMRGEDTIRFFVRVDDAKPWSPESPSLYTVLIKLQQDGRYLDYLTVKVGFQTLARNGDKLSINGRDMAFKMADFIPSPNQATDREHIAKLKKQGVNLLRVLPYPQDEAFYDLCDTEGIYVCDGCDIDTHLAGDSRKRGANPSNDPAWSAAYADRAVAMYHRSKIHPSVIMFSLGARSSNGCNLYESYLALKALGDVRPVVYPEAGGEWNTDMVQRDGQWVFQTRP